MQQARFSPLSLVAILTIIPLAGCSSDPSSGGSSEAAGSSSSSGGSAANGPTFHKDVEPILVKSCQSCHSPGHIAPFSLISYDDAKAVAGLMAMRTSEKTMPPWGAMETAECQPRLGWRDDKRLSDAEIATFKAWNDAGTPEGDPKDAPPPGMQMDEGLPGVELTVEPQKPFVASGNKDEFRCFVLDPKLATDSYLNGSNFIAGNPKVVHHALMFLDPKGDSAALADADGGYDCFGGPGIQGGALIAAWAPGGVPSEYAPNIGMPIPAGSKLVMQIHYHPAGATADPDSTKFQMRFTSAVPEYTAAVTLIGNFKNALPGGDGLLPGPDDPGGTPTFLIPAGVKGHTETMRLTIPQTQGGKKLPPLKIYGAATHMHYVGTDMLITLDRTSPMNGDPAKECVIQTPKWDFNWQRGYTYDADIDALPSLVSGDVLNFRCTYDNTLDNPFVKQSLMQQMLSSPQDVKLGESTLDEMCLGAITVIYKN